jgi:pimeloyl-ACP methyl ester carboxylesterase
MKKETIKGLNDYDIPCLNNLSGGERMAVIISHGFGGCKDGSTAQAVAAVLPRHGIGTYSFDFPAHGDSPVDGEQFRIANCLNDLTAVEAHVRALVPEAEIVYFSSSFGAYINLIYLATCPHVGKKSFLRCAAVDMPRLLRKGTSPEQYAQLDLQGHIIMDYDYVRPLKVTREFYDDLETYDVFKLCRSGMAELLMIHGDADKAAPVADARRFAKQFGARLIEIKGADHCFMLPGGMEQVIHAAVKFFITK